MISGRAGRTIAGFLAGAASLALALFATTDQQDRFRLLAQTSPAQLAPIPAGVLPAGTATPPAVAPLSAAQHQTIADALWRDPFDDKVFNLVYTDMLRTGAPAATADRAADLLSDLGWRYTPAQQNLIIHDAITGRYVEVADRADALLRRQKQPALAYAMLQAMETLPQMHGILVAKLGADPTWRRDYLSVINPQSSPALQAQRVRTLAALQHTPRGLSREEIAPSLVALSGSGRIAIAYALWQRQTGQSTAGNLVYDPQFRQAAAVTGGADLAIPFEWHFGQGVGYDAAPSTAGAEIDWDRHGVPPFLTQFVPVQAGRGYVLTLKGQSGAPLSSLLAPLFVCGATIVRPDQVASGTGQVRYTFAALPQGCDMGLLSIDGALDAGSGETSIAVSDVDLRRWF